MGHKCNSQSNCHQIAGGSIDFDFRSTGLRAKVLQDEFVLKQVDEQGRLELDATFEQDFSAIEYANDDSQFYKSHLKI